MYIPGNEPCVVTPDGKKFFRADLVAPSPAKGQLWEQDATKQPPSKQSSSKQAAKKPKGAKCEDPRDEKAPKTPSPRKKSKSQRKSKGSNSQQSSAPLSRKASEMTLTSVVDSDAKKKMQTGSKPKSLQPAQPDDAPKKVIDTVPINMDTSLPKSGAADRDGDGPAEEAARLSSSPIPEDDSVIAAKLIRHRSTKDSETKDVRRSTSPASSHDDSIIAAKLVGQPPEEIPPVSHVNVGSTSTGSPIMKERHSQVSQRAAILPNAEEPPFASRTDAEALLENCQSTAPVVKLPTPQPSEPDLEAAPSAAQSSTDEPATTSSGVSRAIVEEGQQQVLTIHRSVVADLAPGSRRSRSKTREEPAEPKVTDMKIEDSAKEPQPSFTSPTTDDTFWTASDHGSETLVHKASTTQVVTEHATELQEESTKTVINSRSSPLDAISRTPQNLAERGSCSTEAADAGRKATTSTTTTQESQPAELTVDTVTASPPAQSPLNEDEYPSLATSAHLAKTTAKRSPPLKKAKSPVEKVTKPSKSKKNPPKIAIPSREDLQRSETLGSASATSPAVQTITAAKSPVPVVDDLRSATSSFEEKVEEPSKDSVHEADKSSKSSELADSSVHNQKMTSDLPIETSPRDCIAKTAKEIAPVKVAQLPASAGSKVKTLQDELAGAATETKTSNADPSGLTSEITTFKSIGSIDAPAQITDTLHEPLKRETSILPVPTHKKSTKKKKRSPHPSAKLVLANASKCNEEPRASHGSIDGAEALTRNGLAELDVEATGSSPTKAASCNSPPGGYSMKEGDVKPERVEVMPIFPKAPSDALKRPDSSPPTLLADRQDWKRVKARLPTTGETNQILLWPEAEDSEQNPLMAALNCRTVLQSVRNELERKLGRSPKIQEVKREMSKKGHDVDLDWLAEQLEMFRPDVPDKQPKKIAPATIPVEQDESASVTAQEDSAQDNDAKTKASSKASRKAGKSKKSKKSKSKKDATAVERSTTTASETVSSTREPVLLNPESAVHTTLPSSKAPKADIPPVIAVITRESSDDEQSGPHTPKKPGRIVAFCPTPKQSNATSQDSPKSSADDSNDSSTEVKVNFKEQVAEYRKQKAGYEAKRNVAKTLRQQNLKKVRRKAGSLVEPGKTKTPASQQGSEESHDMERRNDGVPQLHGDGEPLPEGVVDLTEDQKSTRQGEILRLTRA